MGGCSHSIELDFVQPATGSALTLDESKIVRIEVRQGHVLEQDRIGGIERNQHISSDLLTCGLHGGEVCEQVVVKLDHVADCRSRRKVRDGVLPEAGAKHKPVVVPAP